jgi:ribonuclease P protein component
MPARPPRLKQRRDFQRVAGKGARASRPGLVLQALAAPGQPLRVGFTCTKKLGTPWSATAPSAGCGRPHG